MIPSVKEIKINEKIAIGGTNPITFIGGPCVLENEELSLSIAKSIDHICKNLGLNYIFKASYDKANRSSIHSYRGPGMEEGIKIFRRIKKELNIPVLTDVHEPWQCDSIAEVVDVIQIPAFLCRQTDLIIAAAKTGKVVNVKKGQFMAPRDMANVVKKFEESGNTRIMLCERGESFGYNNLVVDMRAIVEMRKMGYPVIFDATHSVQRPGGNGDTTGGDREYVQPLINAASAVGIDALFAEVHPDPDNSPSDGPNMVKLDDLGGILEQAVKIDNIIKLK